MSRLEAQILGVSIWGPALEGWAASRPVLTGEVTYQPAASPAPPPAVLSANERRRTGPVVRLALAVASEAALMSGLSPGSLRSVFASSNGDAIVVGSILEDLIRGGDQSRLVSPTQFHNSVHNAAAGYWSIATGNQRPTTCLSCHDFTWPAALLTVIAELTTHGEPVLLCAYDHPMPAPLHAKRPIIAPFGVGLVLGPREAGGGLAGIAVRFVAEAPPVEALPCDPAFQALALGNPAARSLPLLQALALRACGSHALANLDGHLHVELLP